MVIRRRMDYATGISGLKSGLSYQQFREWLEYLPPPGSRDRPYHGTGDQIKRLVRLLVKAGIIEPLHHSDRPGTKMVFRCLLASTDLDRPEEESHMRATQGKPQEGHKENPATMQDSADCCAAKNATGRPQHESHTSVTSVITTTATDARDPESVAFAMHLDWQPSPQFADRLRVSGVNTEGLSAAERTAVLGEFVSYWLERPGVALRQGQWEHRLLKSVMVSLNRGSAQGSARSEGGVAKQTIDNSKAGKRERITAAIMDVNNIDW